jgi:hypothetical protein
MKTKILFYFFLISFTFCLFSCDTNDPPPPPPPVEEKVENTITVETVWQDLDALQIKFSKSGIDSLSLFSYYLYVNGKEEKRYTSISNETVYTDTGLTEGTEYRYSVKAYEGEELKDTSNILITSTLSTTSHDIEWEVDTLGVPGDYLRDVWGLDENNVWAVGALEVDGRGTNIIRWNGNKWNYFPISGEGWRNGIYGFDESNIWVVGGGTYGIVDHWDGSSWTHYDGEYFRNNVDTVWALNSIWGSSAEDIWAVGQRGTLVHWDGEKWEKVDLSLPEDFIFWDIHGTDSDDVYAAGNVENKEFILFHYDGMEWTKFLKGRSGASYQNTVYTATESLTYLLEIDNYKIKNTNVELFTIPGQTAVMYKIRGSGSNNIVAAGEFGEVFHYNGSSWSKAEGISGLFSKKSLRSVYVTERKIFIVGQELGEGASIITGTIK